MDEINRTSETEFDLAIICIVLVVASIFGAGALITALCICGPSFIAGSEWFALVWAVACLATGFLTGFLFGIPKVTQPAQDGKESKEQAYRQSVNTNLEQISDWLTKIIVGLGLVELRKVPELMKNLADWIAKAFCDPANAYFPVAVSLSSAIVVYFAILGFLAGYLITRLFFAGAFGRADRQDFRNSEFQSASSIARLGAFWRPDGAANPQNEKKLLEWMSRNKIGVSLVSFINDAKLEKQRKRAISELQIP